MTDYQIPMEEIIGKTITDIRCKYAQQDDWLDTADCFIELDYKYNIGIPYGETKNLLLLEPDPLAETIFGDMADIPFYHVNRDAASMVEVAEAQKQRKKNIRNWLRKILFGYEPPLKEYQPFKIEYIENKLKNIVNRTIVDYIWANDRDEKGFFELDNGYIISDQYMAPHGTGLAGFHYYDSLNSLRNQKGNNLNRYSEVTKGSH